MKSFKLLLSVLALVAFAAAPVLRAEDAPAPGASAHKKGPHGGDRLAELTKKLDLTDDQVAKIKPIIADEMAAMKALKEDTSTDMAAKKEKMMEIRKSHMKEIFEILTPEQQEKLKAAKGDQKPGNNPGKKQGGKKKDKKAE